jgi:hypothetical protein
MSTQATASRDPFKIDPDPQSAPATVERPGAGHGGIDSMPHPILRRFVPPTPEGPR